MNLVRAVGISVMATGFVLAPVPFAHAASTPVPAPVSVQGPYGVDEVTVPIPDGTRPKRFTGRIRSQFTIPGSFLIEINDSVRKRVPIRGGKFSVPLRARDVRDGGVNIALMVNLRPSKDCLRDDQAQAFIRDARVVLNRRPPRPRTLADFLNTTTERFVVTVPREPSTEEQAAGLDAVLALRHAIGSGPKITLRTTNQPPKTTLKRRVVVVDEDGTGSSALAVRAGRLYVTGSPEEVAKAAISLSDPNVTLLKVRSVTNLAGTADYNPVPNSTTLAELGVEPFALAGIGTLSSTMTISQAAFGQPVSELVLNLRGAVTPVTRGQQGRVNIRWNDQLVASQLVTDSSALTLNRTGNAGSLLSVNRLQTDFEYLPARKACRTRLPGELQIDPAASTVEASFGDSAAPGFQRFPQSFGPQIPVSFGLAARPALRNAARVLDSAASVSPLQYTVEILEDPAQRPGSLVAGATNTQAQNLGAPLPDQQNLANFPPGRSTPYAALQAFNGGGNDMIVLSAEPPKSAKVLANWPAAQEGGWAGLTGQVYVKASDSGAPQAFQAGSSSEGGSRLPLIAGGVVVLALLAGAGAFFGWRYLRR